MTSHRFLCALGGILGSMMLLAPSAGADSRHYTAAPGYLTKVQLQGSNGYRVDVFTGQRHGVTVKVHKGNLVSKYEVRGAENGKYGVDARLPGLGRVRFRFVPNGRERRIPPPPSCEGPKMRLIDGVVRGRIRFTGEEGYTRVTVKRAKAEVEAWPRLRCRYLEPEGRPRKWTAAFDAFRETAPNVSFLVTRFGKKFRPSSRQVDFEAYLALSRGPVRIFHSASVAADASSFVLLSPKAAPENFTVTPPPPFSGTATFQRTPESVFSWEGDLSIQFPGAAPVALAGPFFNTHYCALRGCIDQEAIYR